MAKTKIYSQVEFEKWAEIHLYPKDREIFDPQLPHLEEDEELWDSEWTPNPHQLYQPKINLLRLIDTNWWVFLDYEKDSSRWVHLKNYLDWAIEVLPFIKEEGIYEICNFNRLWTFPKIVPYYNLARTFDVKIHYSDIDKEILQNYKYRYYQELRPVNPVYALACYIHASVQYSGTGFWCNADKYEGEYGEMTYEYNGLPDDISILIAHAAIVMCDKERVRNLQLIRKAVMSFRKEYVDILTYDELIRSNAIYMA